MDRLSRSLKDLLFVVDKIRSAKATFTSLTEHLDTKGPAGEALMQMIGVFAQFERSMISERTRLGVRQAIADGKIVGQAAMGAITWPIQALKSAGVLRTIAW